MWGTSSCDSVSVFFLHLYNHVLTDVKCKLKSLCAILKTKWTLDKLNPWTGSLLKWWTWNIIPMEALSGHVLFYSYILLPPFSHDNEFIFLRSQENWALFSRDNDTVKSRFRDNVNSCWPDPDWWMWSTDLQILLIVLHWMSTQDLFITRKIMELSCYHKKKKKIKYVNTWPLRASICTC